MVQETKRIEEPWDGDAAMWLEERSAQPIFIEAVGTIGHGNHFAELVRIAEQIFVSGNSLSVKPVASLLFRGH